MLGLGLLQLGCTGDLLGGSGAPSDGFGPGQAGSMSPAGGAAAGGLEPMGTTVLHRLNQVELRNTVVQIFGDGAAEALRAGVDPLVQGFDSNADALTISEAGVDSLMRMAEELVQGIDLPALLPCAGLMGPACAEQRIASMALRLLRRAPSADETSSYLALWTEVAARTDEDTATRAVLQRLLMTPDFLYHVELGDAVGELNAYELAARLAYFAWESTPDDALLAEARSGALDDAAGAEAALNRLLQDPRGQATFGRFFELWAELDKLDAAVKDVAVYPEFDKLKAPMADEFRAFIGDLFSRDATVKELFTSTTTFASPDLATLYAGSSGQRAGILTQGAFLAAHGKANKSAPIMRGRFIREQVLCAPVPPPPPGADTVEPNAEVPVTTREYYAKLTSGAVCATCHDQLNPMGFAFEGFDGIGRARTMENSHAIDTSGAITAGDVAGPVSDALELATRLGESQSVRLCLTKQLFRSRFRRIDVAGDSAIIDTVAAGLSADGDRLMSLARILARQDAMRRKHFRVAAAGEGAP